MIEHSVIEHSMIERAELDALVAGLPAAGFVAGVTSWLGGEDTTYTLARDGRITVLVLSCYGPWTVLFGPAAHSAHWPYVHAPMQRREFEPPDAVRFALLQGSAGRDSGDG